MTQDDDPSSHDTPGCGIYWLWQKTNDEYARQCLAHDNAYDSVIAGDRSASAAKIDKAFLTQMLAVAGNSRWQKTRAYFFYGLARAWSLTARRGLWKP